MFWNQQRLQQTAVRSKFYRPNPTNIHLEPITIPLIFLHPQPQPSDYYQCSIDYG